MSETITAVQMNKPLIPSGVIGIVIFVFTEIMLFAGLISAYFVARGGAEVWPPWGQPRLPILATGFNTMILLGSGICLLLARKYFDRDDSLTKVKKIFGFSIILGTFFVLFQGYEWVKLIEYGLTITSSTYGGLFYVIIGAHAVHAIAGLFFLAKSYIAMELIHKRRNESSEFDVISIFWFFVVGMWPILYITVYVL